jgi:SprT protein
MKDLISRVENQVLETFEQAQRIFGRTFDIPTLSYSINSGGKAGYAQYRQWHIAINDKYLVAHPDTVINEVVPHEVAHLLTFNLFPRFRQHHGPEWKSVMRRLGLPPARCHRMQLVEAHPHTYVCNCRKHFVSDLIHRRMMVQPRWCRKCRSTVVFLNTKTLDS